MAVTYSNDVLRSVGAVADITGAKTLTEGDSGVVYFLKASAGALVTLPAVKKGLQFKFIVGQAFATSDWVIDSAEGDNIEGTLVVAGSALPAVGEDQVNFKFGAESVGDFVALECDGAKWFVSGMGNNASSITVTDPS